MRDFLKKLQELQTSGRYRRLMKPQGIDLTSNDYLGLANHSALKNILQQWLENDHPIGAGGSRLLRGHTDTHEELETFAADFYGCDKTLYFASGFQANYALFTTLLDRHDTIIFDALLHASARDGIQASGAKRKKVPHNDLAAIEDALKTIEGSAWIAVESVYSMDGDLAPLTELADLARRYEAWLIIDEAHGTGVFGPSGKGLSEGLPHDHLITVHTCGKALGVAGGLVCGPAQIIDFMINKARPFIYSTAPMPVQAALVKRALELTQEEPERRTQLRALRDHANHLFPDVNSQSQIFPIIFGDDQRTVEIADTLQQNGFDIRAIRPPTVPEGTARLRLSLNCHLQASDLDQFSTYLNPYLQEKAA